MSRILLKLADFTPFLLTLTLLQKAYEVNWLEDDEEEYQETLKGLTGIRTVPQVFVFGEFVGGSDDTMVAYESGKLERMLAGG